jgi:hypothetical protein
MADPIVFAGNVEWSGENPGISLKDQPDGPFVTLASFFRVVLSPHGRGHALVLLPLARYLVEGFIAHFGAWRGVPGLAGLTYHRLDSVEAAGDPASRYSETVKAGDLTVQLTWNGLGTPFCFALPPDKSATGRHHMPSLFVGCADATVTVNGRVLPGKPVPREIAGHRITTAMLAFSETWIKV